MIGLPRNGGHGPGKAAPEWISDRGAIVIANPLAVNNCAVVLCRSLEKLNYGQGGQAKTRASSLVSGERTAIHVYLKAAPTV